MSVESKRGGRERRRQELQQSSGCTSSVSQWTMPKPWRQPRDLTPLEQTFVRRQVVMLRMYLHARHAGTPDLTLNSARRRTSSGASIQRLSTTFRAQVHIGFSASWHACILLTLTPLRVITLSERRGQAAPPSAWADCPGKGTSTVSG